MTDVRINGALAPPGAVPAAPAAPAARPAAPPRSGPSFGEVLAREAQGLRFSKHALQRLERRGIEVEPQQLQRLEAGVGRAAAKGSRDSVIFLDGTAFVVSVRNRTVVTAVDNEHMREQVFTNIDSAVIA